MITSWEDMDSTPVDNNTRGWNTHDRNLDNLEYCLPCLEMHIERTDVTILWIETIGIDQHIDMHIIFRLRVRRRREGDKG